VARAYLVSIAASIVASIAASIEQLLRRLPRAFLTRFSPAGKFGAVVDCHRFAVMPRRPIEKICPGRADSPDEILVSLYKDNE